MSLRLKIIIALMSIALLGLVLIQFYWIDSAIVLKKDEFNQKVVFAMRNVVHKLEKKEAMEQFRRHRLGRQLIHQKMMRRHKHFQNHRRGMGHGPQHPFRTIEKDIDGGKVRITEHLSNDSTTKIVTREFNTGNSNSVQIDVNINGEQSQWLAGTDSSLLIDKMEEKSAFIDDIIIDLMEDSPFKSIQERLDIPELDSMLKAELAEAMINTEVEFGVFDYFGRLIGNAGNDEKENSLRKSIYKTRLFPNDMFGEPYFLSINFPNQKGYLLKSMWVTLTISTLFLLLIVAAFSYTVQVIQSQKKLSIIKNDFISNMTHELKTPISTISLACEALSDADVSKDENRKSKFLQMISHENKRLGILVENVLKSSIWDKSDFKLNLNPVNFHEIISEVVETSKVVVEQKNGQIAMNLNAKVFELQGDKVHLTNIMHNLIDNAIKYSDNEIDITVSTRNDKNNIYVEVEDKGIGISKDQQKKIFDKFYRIPTGNIHNVKGFGLGLNYVQNVIRNHGGNIEVKSTPGKGSCFSFHLPFNFNG